MGLPPATPTPSRFLLSKRPHTQQSQAQTPNPQVSNGSQRFHPTPRFSTSTPRPSSSAVRAATPALAIKPKTPRLRTTQDLIDDSSPLSDEEKDGPSLLPETNLPEPIEFESSLVPQSSLPIKEEEDQDDYDDDFPIPQPKRRRISITSLISSPPLPPQQEIIPITSPQLSDDDDDDIEIEPPNSDPDPDQDLITSFRSSPPPPPPPRLDLDLDLNLNIPSSSITIRLEDDPDHPPPPPSSSPIEDLTRPTHNSIKKEPIFHPPPKFKHPPQAPGSPSSDVKLVVILPETPTHGRHSRKKQKDKYLPFGLASEVRDWLVDAKELFNPPPPPAVEDDLLAITVPSSVQLELTKVQHAAGGAGMVVVSARQHPGQQQEGGGGGGGGGEVNAILAGEGTAVVNAGLDRDRNGGGGGGGIPKRGSTVSIGMPAWDVDLGEGLGTWAVAYRWEVMKDKEPENKHNHEERFR
ncbi:hypothetical protein QBC43DRAFT_321169 [Cladorrhinum sp. PSN259]|nr:hypothetical protein QBC43DRAFT_321169 [Cladorrhinum sp. PSN259]